jgi:hypothetical protein
MAQITSYVQCLVTGNPLLNTIIRWRASRLGGRSRTIKFLITPEAQPLFITEYAGNRLIAKGYLGFDCRTVCAMEGAVEPRGMDLPPVI